MIGPAIGNLLQAMLDMHGPDPRSQAVLQLNHQMQQHTGIEASTKGDKVVIGPGQAGQNLLKSL
jgi:hypothetical protein